MSLRPGWTPIVFIAIAICAWQSEVVVRTQSESGRIVVTYWEKWTGFEGEAMRAVVDEFNRSQDRIEVRLLTISNIQNKTLLATSGGNPPDVAGLFGPNVAQYVDQQAILSLGDYCRRFGIDREDYIPAYWDIGYYRGDIWALPSTPASTALVYNRGMLELEGITEPPTTIEDLDALSERLTVRDANGRITRSGFLPNEPGWWNWAWGYFFGGALWDGDSTITTAAPENIVAFDWVRSYASRYGAADIQTFRSGFGSFSSPQNAFMAEKVAMVLQGVWMPHFVRQYAPELRIGAMPFPHPANRPDLARTTIVDMDILVIPRGAKHPDEAFEFIRFVQSRRGMELLCSGQEKHSPLATTSPEFIANHRNPHVELFTELARSPNAVAPPKMGIWPEYQAELSAAFDEIYTMERPAAEVLARVQTRIQRELDEHIARQRQRDLRANR